MNRRDRTSVVCFCPNSPTELRQERNRCVRGRVGKGDRNSTVVWLHIFKNDWSLQISVFHFYHSLKSLNENNRNSKTKSKVVKINSSKSQGKGLFTNWVYKTRQAGGPKMSTFCQLSYHRKCQRRGVGGQEMPKSCQRSL